MLRTLILLMTAPAFLSGQEFLQNPLRFWQQESAYAGSDACKTCHSEICEQQAVSHHALSLRPASEAPQFTSGLPVQRMDPVSGSTLSLTARSDRGPEMTASNGSEHASLQLDWAFGSGVKGITPVGRRPSGEFLEGRLSWYSSLSEFDFTPGDTKYTPTTAAESLGRLKTIQEIGECFGCHTSAYDEESPAPVGKDIGIRCERCHGPGQEHIRAAREGGTPSAKIFHPGRMPAFPQVQMCGACHGKPPQDSDLTALQYIEATPNTARFPSQRLVLSRCFNESAGGLKCTSCHDPHTNAVRAAGQNDKNCLVCHDVAAQRGERSCPAGKDNCVSCHMPQERVMANSSFTDHWIRVVRRGPNAAAGGR